MFIFRFFQPVAAALLSLAVASHTVSAAPSGFSFQDAPGDHLDVLSGGKPVVRYMYAFDDSSPARKTETYKPFLHVFAPDGTTLLTKGAGGMFPHHRGIFIGWTKLGFGGKTLNLWGMNSGVQVHQKFTAQKAGAAQAEFTSLVLWKETDGTVVLEEERTQRVQHGKAPLFTVIDFSTRLRAPNGDVMLDGDPEHAGVHFRPADEVERTPSYAFPRENADPTKQTDFPWVGATFKLAGKKYTAVEMSHPANPKGTRWSAYRDYGRFGAFPKAELKQGGSLTLSYRFVMAEGEWPGAGVIQASYNDFAGTTDAVPPVTVLSSENKQDKKKAQAAEPKKKAGDIKK